MSDMFDVSAIDKYFPMESYREGQREVIEFVFKSFNANKKIVILECPTGSGKSAIGMTLANSVGNSYYLTITKVLQDQLVRDFAGSIVELKGRGAYPCTFYERIGPDFVRKGIWKQSYVDTEIKNKRTCSNGFCKSKMNQRLNRSLFKCKQCFMSDDNGSLSILPAGMNYSACPYYESVYTAINSKTVTMNFSSFLYQTAHTNRFDILRDLMIIDEGHNLESQILDFVSLTLNDKHLSKHGIFIPDLDSAEEYAVWFQDCGLLNIINQLITEAQNDENHELADEFKSILYKYTLFIQQVMSKNTEWVHEHHSGAYNEVILKPVFAMSFVYPLLFKYAKRVVIMSATILDVDIMCQSLGIKRADVAAYRMKNRFPAENRPIYIDTVGSMSGGKDKLDQLKGKLVNKVNRIVNDYPNEKGIIHTHNFAIADVLLKECDSKVKSRFLFQKNFADKSEMLRAHKDSLNSVLVAPAMHEGIDLFGDLSRFQIIAKVPYPNCFDNKQLARRVEIDRRYYLWLTALKLIQSYGRSIRSIDDHADTYILDEAINKFHEDAEFLLPKWYIDAIVDL